MLSSKFNTILKYGLYLIILLPLAFTPFTFFPWHFGKTVIFQILIEILLFLFLVSRLCHSERSEKSLVFLKRLNCLDWFILFFLAVITITSLTGVNPVNSFWGNQARANGVFTWLHFGAFYFLLKNYFQNRQSSVIPAQAGIQQPPSWRLDSLFQGNDKWIIVISVTVAAIASITALFPNLLPESWRSISGGGIIGNRAFLASYLILAAGISLYLFAYFLCHSREACPRPRSRSGNPAVYRNKWRWLFLAASVLFFYTIIDTGNRGALLGIVIGAFFGLMLCLFFIRHKKVKIWSAVFLILLCSLFFALFLSRQSLFWQKYFPPLSDLASISLSSGTAETRLMAWQIGLDGLKEKPLLGWGWGNYEIIFNKYYNPQFLKYSFVETVWDKPHNWLLEIVVTAGILGIIGYLAILFFAFYYLLRHCEPRNIAGRGNPIHSVGKIILFTTLVAYFVQDLFLFETTNGLILWFVILAFISASGCHPHWSSPSTAIRGGNDKMRHFFVLPSILLIFYFLFFNLRSLQSSYYMRQAELATNINDWSAAAQKTLAISVPFISENAIFLAQQFTQFDKAGAIFKDTNIENAALQIAKTLGNESKKYPDNLALPVWEGQVYLVEGEKFDAKYYADAEKALNRALEIAPRKQEVLFLLVRLYLLKQDFARAIEFSQKAINVAPDISTSHWFFGLANVASGHRMQGIKSIEKAIELGYSLTVDQELYVFDLYAIEKNYPKLIDEYKKKIEANPENINWLIKLATVYAESGDKKAALETTRQAVGLFPPLKIEAEKFIKQYKLLEK